MHGLRCLQLESAGAALRNGSVWRRGRRGAGGRDTRCGAASAHSAHGALRWQTFRFINGKNEACFHMKRNPRKLNWTLFYRRLRKKGTQEDVLKKAKKRIVTSTAMTRGIAGLSIEDLKAKKSEAPERRKAMREATVR